MDDETDTVRTQGAAQPRAGEKAHTSYDSDFYTWSQEQGRLVREGRWSEVDRENVAEEIESWGGNNSTSSRAPCAS